MEILDSTRFKLFDVAIDNLSLSEILQKIEQFIQEKRFHQIITVNSLMLNALSKDIELKTVFQKAHLVLPESFGISLASKILGQHLTERIAGIDLIYYLCQLSEKNGYKMYLLGSRPGRAELTAQKLKQKYPLLKIVGTYHGYFDKSQEGQILKEIKDVHPDILLVGLDIPYQEKWIFKNISLLHIPVCMGVGGSFDVLSGKLKRAPIWMQKLGLEWFWRFLRQPWRIKRIIFLPVFISKVLHYKWTNKSI